MQPTRATRNYKNFCSTNQMLGVLVSTLYGVHENTRTTYRWTYYSCGCSQPEKLMQKTTWYGGCSQYCCAECVCPDHCSELCIKRLIQWNRRPVKSSAENAYSRCGKFPLNTANCDVAPWAKYRPAVTMKSLDTGKMVKDSYDGSANT
jgi:hypothetical protein